MAISFCTLAIHAPYRERARLLCGDLVPFPVFVLTDQPADFADLPVRTVAHTPSGPMAADYLERLPATGNHQGAAAYHDKLFALRVGLRDFDSTIFLDADTRLSGGVPAFGALPTGLAVTPVTTASVADHLQTCGSWRQPFFTQLAVEMSGDAQILHRARWCHEACLAVTKDGREGGFFAAWEKAAAFMRRAGVFSGEGGVIGLAAAVTGWPVDYEAIGPLASAIQHEGGGPKSSRFSRLLAERG